jgi:hypothetical protein
VDLRRLILGPRGERGRERLAVAHPVRVVAVVVERVPDHAQAGALRQRHHVADSERAVVVLDHEPPPGRLAQHLEAGEEPRARRLYPSRGAADVQHHDRLWTQLHRVEQRGLHLQLGHRGRPHALLGRVQHRVLARMRREPDAALARQPAHRGELLRALLDLAVELRQLGMARVGRERGGHPVHPDVVRVAVVEDRPQPLERVAQVRPGLPAARVVRRQAAVTEHLHGEAEAVGCHPVDWSWAGSPGASQRMLSRTSVGALANACSASSRVSWKCFQPA